MTINEFVISLRSLFPAKFISAFGNVIKNRKSSFPCSSKNDYRPQNIGIELNYIDYLFYAMTNFGIYYTIFNIINSQFCLIEELLQF